MTKISRIQQAKVEVALSQILGLTRILMESICPHDTATAREKEQFVKINHWRSECEKAVGGRIRPISAAAERAIMRNSEIVQQIIRKHIGAGKFGNSEASALLATVWALVWDARVMGLVPQKATTKWRFLAQTINTLLNWAMADADQDEVDELMLTVGEPIYDVIMDDAGEFRRAA